MVVVTRKLVNASEKLHNLYSSLNIIRMRWVELLAHMQEKRDWESQNGRDNYEELDVEWRVVLKLI
jgi:hypothetical protein